MRHHDLLSTAHAPEEVGEEVAGISGVVFGELAWLGVAKWRGLATPSEKPLQHGGELDRQPDTRLTEMCADFVDRLARAQIGATYNQYAASEPLRDRLRSYLEDRADAEIVLVGEAAGYRGARVSGIPFTSERQLNGSGPAEATATIVHRVLERLGVADEILLWNVVPTHPGTATSNRRPRRDEVGAASPFLHELARSRKAIAVGRLAAAVLDAPYIRHPSYGGAAEFEEGLQRAFATIRRRRARVRRFL